MSKCCFYLNSYLCKGRKGQGLSKWPDLESQTSIYSWKLRAAPTGQRVNLEFIFKPGTKFSLFSNRKILEYTAQRSLTSGQRVNLEFILNFEGPKSVECVKCLNSSGQNHKVTCLDFLTLRGCFNYMGMKSCVFHL